MERISLLMEHAARAIWRWRWRLWRVKNKLRLLFNRRSVGAIRNPKRRLFLLVLGNCMHRKPRSHEHQSLTVLRRRR